MMKVSDIFGSDISAARRAGLSGSQCKGLLNQQVKALSTRLAEMFDYLRICLAMIIAVSPVRIRLTLRTSPSHLGKSLSTRKGVSMHFLALPKTFSPVQTLQTLRSSLSHLGAYKSQSRTDRCPESCPSCQPKQIDGQGLDRRWKILLFIAYRKITTRQSTP